jgi:hypothetical protein
MVLAWTARARGLRFVCFVRFPLATSGRISREARGARRITAADHRDRQARRIPVHAGNGGMATMSTLEEWMTTVRAELALDGDGVADLRVVQTVVLDLARDAAHGVARPAAPLTAYLVGVAVGRGAPLGETAARIAELALAGQADQQPPEETS